MSTSYSFIFQCNQDGSMSLSYQPAPPVGKKGAGKFPENALIMPVLLAPAGSTEVMSDLTMNFHEQAGPAGPFGKGDDATFTWSIGDKPTKTVNQYGLWDFSATVKSSSGAVYTLPDPELQIGDGPGEEAS